MFINAVASIALAFLGQASAQPVAPAVQPAAPVATTAAPMDNAAQIKASLAKEKAALKELTAKEKADIKAVWDDKTLDKTQSHEKIKAIRKDYRAQRKDIKAKGKAERQALKK